MMGIFDTIFIFFIQKTGILWIAISLIVIMIRSILLPLYIQFTKTQRKVQNISGEMEALKKEHKNNSKILAEKMLALYKRDNIKIYYIFLALLIQIPLYIFLFFAIKDTSIGAEITSTLFIFDLLAFNDYIFAFIVGIVQLAAVYANQKTNPPKDDKTKKIQSIILISIPLLIGSSAIFLGNTLGFYFIAMSIFSIIQDLFIDWYLKPKENHLSC